MPDFRYIKGSNYPIWEIRIKHPKGEILKAEKLIEDIERRVGG